MSDTKPQLAEKLPSINISVTALSESVYRHGGLAGGSFNTDALEGIRLHRYYTDAMTGKYGSRVMSEYPLKGLYQNNQLTITVNGRCDLILRAEDNYGTKTSEADLAEDTLIEIKTHGLSPQNLPQGTDQLHWAQLKIYGYLYLLENPGKESVKLELVYLSIIDRNRKLWQKSLTLSELADFFAKTCEDYLTIAGNWFSWQKYRDQSACQVGFPYSQIRSGQKDMMNEILACIRQNDALFIQAPTGIGKTMSAVFPAVRALGHHLTDHVFYLTAMTSTRQAAVNALNDLRVKGLRIRSIVLHAKEKICLQPEIYCDSVNCPYAVSYYNNLPDAIRTLMLLEEIKLEDLLACAKKYQVCPFELSLDISLYCDFIICDYNYAFDPRVKLERFFGGQPRSCLLLVDEAHNLPDRSREMYSASLSQHTVAAANKLLSAWLNPETGSHTQPVSADLKHLAACVKQLLNWFDKLNQVVFSQTVNQGFELVEKDCKETDSMKAPGFLGMRKKPQTLMAASGRCRYFMRTCLEAITSFSDKKIMLALYFELLFFARIADLYDRGYHITTFVQDHEHKGQAVLNLQCLDASSFLSDTYLQKRPAVFFSATMSPVSYYIGLIHGKATQMPPQSLILASPFPSENLLLMTYTSISVRYKDRDNTLTELLDLVLAVVSGHIGNYLLFVPSYAYLSKFRKLLRQHKPEDIDCLLQIPGMDDRLKSQFLGRFERHGSKSLLAVAVMGSFFNEGIDLAGDKLSGVIIIGTGMPQISPEREILKQYYDAGIGSGFAYSYVYPGFNKVQQAAGRVIRSENDRGFVLLIDDRYDKYEYRELFPHEWQTASMSSQDEIIKSLNEFWHD